MRARLLGLCVLASCTATSPRPAADHPTGPVQVVTQTVVVRVPNTEPLPPPRGRGFIKAYAQAFPRFRTVLIRAKHADTVQRLVAIDRRVRRSLVPFESHPRSISQADVDEAIDALGSMREVVAVSSP